MAANVRGSGSRRVGEIVGVANVARSGPLSQRSLESAKSHGRLAEIGVARSGASFGKMESAFRLMSRDVAQSMAGLYSC
jgi:hypothetical protein